MRYLPLVLCVSALLAQTVERSVYMGGSGDPRAIAVAPNGELIVAGDTGFGSFITTGSPLPAGGDGDVFLQRYSPDLTELRMSVRIGGAGLNTLTAMALDSEGNIYVAGSTPGDFPTTAGGFFPARAGTFVAKLNPSADTLLWSTYFPANVINDIAIDSQGRVNITGAAWSSLIVTADAVQPVLRQTLCAAPLGPRVGVLPCPDAFLTRLNATDGTLVYSTFYGGGGGGSPISGSDAGSVLTAGPDGVTYAGGLTTSIDFPVTAGPIQKEGDADAFVFAIGPDGRDRRFSRLLNEAGAGQTTDIAISDNGGLTVLGTLGILGSVSSAQGVLLLPQRSFLMQLSADGTSASPARELGLSSRLLVRGEETWLVGSAFAEPANLRYCLDTTFLSRVENGVVAPQGYFVRLGPLAAMGPEGTVYLAGRAERVLPGSAAGAPGHSFGDASGFGFRVSRVIPGENPPGFVSCIVNAASFKVNPQDGATATIAPGEIVAITGMGLGPAEGVPAIPTGGRFPTSLAGTRVLFDGVPAPLLYVQDRQINAIVPFSLAAPTSRFVVERTGVELPGAEVLARSTAPGVFTENQAGSGQIIAANQDGSRNSALNPADSGSLVAFYATGLGQPNPPLEDGLITPLDAARPVLTSIQVRIGAELANVEYAGPAPGLVAGVYQVNIRIPASLASNSYPIFMTANGEVTSQLGTLSIRVR